MERDTFPAFNYDRFRFCFALLVTTGFVFVLVLVDASPIKVSVTQGKRIHWQNSTLSAKNSSTEPEKHSSFETSSISGTGGTCSDVAANTCFTVYRGGNQQQQQYHQPPQLHQKQMNQLHQQQPIQTRQQPTTIQIRPPMQHDPRQDALLQELAWKCPSSFVSERVRFLKGHQAKASETLRSYIEWRNRWQTLREYMFGLQQQQTVFDSAYDRDRADWNEWNIAVEIAKRIVWEDNASSGSNSNNNNYQHSQFGSVPRCIQSYARLDCDMEWTDRYGHKVLVFRPGQMDDRIVSLSTYALAIAIYVDSKVRRDSYERMTVLIDVRAGVGWKNIPARQMIVQQPSFIREISKSLLLLLPERLYMSIMFPVPVTLRWIWSATSQFLEPITAKKFCLLTGPAAADSPQPVDELKKYLDNELVSILEQDRINNFIQL